MARFKIIDNPLYFYNPLTNRFLCETIEPLLLLRKFRGIFALIPSMFHRHPPIHFKRMLLKQHNAQQYPGICVILAYLKGEISYICYNRYHHSKKSKSNIPYFDLVHKPIAPEIQFPKANIFGLEICRQIAHRKNIQ